jgi:DNA-binding response OmpR family regulator
MSEKTKILIVDDERDIATALSIRLKASGYEVIIANDGLSGLDMARKQNPDLLLLDVMLPKLDGFKLCRILKFDEKYKHIPVIMITAKVSENDKKIGGEVGADAYITKPFVPEELLSKIREILSKMPACPVGREKA